MPFVQISLRSGQTAEYRRAVADGVHRAMVETIGIPSDDRFQVIDQYSSSDLIYDSQYLGIERTDDVVFVRITLAVGRTVAQKRALYAAIAARLAVHPGVRPEDVLVVLTEVAVENWSFGSGVAQYADRRPQWIPQPT